MASSVVLARYGLVHAFHRPSLVCVPSLHVQTTPVSGQEGAIESYCLLVCKRLKGAQVCATGNGFM